MKFFLLWLCFAAVPDQGIDQLLHDVNDKLLAYRNEIELCYTELSSLTQSDASEKEFYELLQKVNRLKQEKAALEKKWRLASVDEAKHEEEGYALWDQQEATLAQLVMEYGASDFLYVVPQEMGSLKLNMHSNIPIPRESWGEVLEIILAQNGVGVKKINNYTRQLYIFKQDLSAVQHIVSKREDLSWIPPQTRVFFVLSPPIEQVKSVFQFFERFSDTKQTFVYQVGPRVAIVSMKEEVDKLLALYDTVWREAKGKVSKVVPVSKMAVKEMEKVLQSFFGEAVEKSRPPFGKVEQEGLTIFSLAQGNALVLIGQQEVVDRAEKIIRDTEEQLHDPAEMTVYLYTCRHSDPTDLSKVLEKVYASLLVSGNEGGKESELTITQQQNQFKSPPDGYAPAPPLVVSPQPIKPASTTHTEFEQGSDHFIPDPKTGNLLMVVRRDALSKIKDLLRKLDVPKKMVQIEVLLFEKRINNQTSYGLNLLKIGTTKGVNYNSVFAPSGAGVLQFFFKGAKSSHFPAYDIAYSFLMTQEDIQLNAAPSVTTVNQVPAQVAIVEEISINNGAAPIDTNKGTAFEKSYSRSQYGITIVLTPTIHLPDEGEKLPQGKGFVTLQTDLTFDTTKPGEDDRPLVDRRHIENEVRVLDGQTIILGGLRRKSSHDSEEKIPFLGEIPGIGKLFGSTKLRSHNTEMFFFITPKIILDPQDELLQIRADELSKRAGDLPEFLEKVNEAREKERKKYFQQSLQLLFQ